MVKKVYHVLPWLLWAAIIITMPITSMPLVARLISPGTTVASPAGLFLLAMIIVWFVPQAFKGRHLSQQTIPLIAFVLFVTAAALVSNFYIEPPYKSEIPLHKMLEAFFTLAIGLGFYFVVSWWLEDRKKIEWTIRLINLSGILILVWCAAQSISWLWFSRYPEWMKSIHEFYSVGPLYRQRVSGFAFEPSWFAHQLNMIYLPLWFSLSINRVSTHRFRIFKLTLENILLLGGMVALFLTYSRVGLVAFLLVVAYFVVRMNISLINNVQQRIWLQRSGFFQRINPKMRIIILCLPLVVLYLGVLWGVGFGLSRIDPRMSKLFVFEFNRPDAVLYYANQLTFASRLVYWQAGWNLFNDYPWLGVGLGKAGFYLPDYLSAYAWKLVEVRDLVYRSTSALNIKSIWVRLLAETGIVGFSIFISWLWGLWQTTRKVEMASDPLMKSIAWMGKFVIIGLILEGFSIDSFALPYFWFSFGMLTASVELLDQTRNKEK